MHTYDNVNRRLTENWLNTSGTATYTISDSYDAAGRLTSATAPDSTYSYTYDNANRLTAVDNLGTPGAPHIFINYGYDAANNTTSVSDNFGAMVNYNYDAANRLVQAQETISGSVLAQVGFGYDAANRLTSATHTAGSSDSISSAYTYDAANRLTGISHSSSVVGALSSFAYGYDNANRVTSYSGPDGSLSYTYDSTNQLTAVTGSHGESYNYDNNGNRDTNGNTPGADNRQASDGTYNYTYDNNGNVLTQTRISDGQVTTFTWDDRNRLTEAVVKTAQGALVTDDKFTYDVNDQRIGVAVNGSQTWTAYAGANAFADFSSSGALLVHYLYGLGMDTLLARVDASNNTAFYLSDNLGSVRQVVSVSGSLLDTLSYDAFGNILSETNSGNGDRFKYTSREWNAELGLYYNRARYYNPSTGKFLSEDPSGLGPDINPYRYTGNDASNATDASGLDWNSLELWLLSPA